VLVNVWVHASVFSLNFIYFYCPAVFLVVNSSVFCCCFDQLVCFLIFLSVWCQCFCSVLFIKINLVIFFTAKMERRDWSSSIDGCFLFFLEEIGVLQLMLAFFFLLVS
jgi:hypothetical protein